MVKISADIRDRIFMEKLKSFIENIEKNTKWQEKFSDIEECSKISKRLLYIVDSCDDDKKLKLIGMAFNYLVKGEMNKDDYFFTVNMISKSFYPYLEMLLDIDESDERFPLTKHTSHNKFLCHLSLASMIHSIYLINLL